MMKNITWLLAGFLLAAFAELPVCSAWECDEDEVAFTHKPSDYYGSGEFFTTCPEGDIQIRCYHYHRHWVCEKGEIYYWDRNLESAARTACGCPLLPGTAPSSAAVSKKPEKRFHDIPSKKGETSAPSISP